LDMVKMEARSIWEAIAVVQKGMMEINVGW
jgi:hypothetical protein